MNKFSPLPPPPISTTIPGACAMIGIQKTKMYELIASGAVDTVLIGRRRLVKVESLRALVGAA